MGPRMRRTMPPSTKRKNHHRPYAHFTVTISHRASPVLLRLLWAHIHSTWNIQSKSACAYIIICIIDKKFKWKNCSEIWKGTIVGARVAETDLGMGCRVIVLFEWWRICGMLVSFGAKSRISDVFSLFSTTKFDTDDRGDAAGSYFFSFPELRRGTKKI